MQSQSGRRVSFDIEIANIFELKPGEDLDQYGPFDISCAAAGAAEITAQTAMIMAKYIGFWWFLCVF